VLPETVQSRLLSPDFDWRRSALLEEPLPPAQEAALSGVSDSMAGEVVIRGTAPQEIVIAVQTPQPAFLVVSEAYYPGWEATLDGRPAPVYRTNGVLRGMFIPDGNHEVRFTFRPRPLRIALVMAMVGLLLAFGVILMARRGDWVRRED
jgi:hypothetical protein